MFFAEAIFAFKNFISNSPLFSNSAITDFFFNSAYFFNTRNCIRGIERNIITVVERLRDEKVFFPIL
jgi:hypothetical protein